MKSSLIPIGLACACVSLARADFAPIPLDPTSFNHDPVIEKAAPKVVNDFVTADPNSGTNKVQASGTSLNGALYEKGFNTVNATSGFPVHASQVVKTNTSTANVYTFQMPPDYHANNCLFLGHNNNPNPNWTPIWLQGTLTLSTPAHFSAISVLNTSGNGACLIQATVHFVGGGTETSTFSSTDWWNGAGDTAITRMFDCMGLISMAGGVGQLAVNHGVVWANDIFLSDQTDNVTSIDFKWLHGSTQGSSPWGNGRTMIFGLAGSTDGVNFTAVPVTGFNADVIYEADAPATWGSGNNVDAAILTNGPTYCTVTMDGNVAKTGSTWFEKGYYALQPNSGMPTAGSTINSAARPFIRYTLPASYSNNCAYFLTGSGPGITNATIKFATPTAASSLAFLVGGGNGGLGIRVEIGFQGGTSETNYITAPDWFTRDTVPSAYVCFGRVAPSVRAVNNTPDQFANGFMPPNLIGIGPQPFSRDPRNGAGGNAGGQLNANIPGVRLYDVIIPVAGSGQISTINLIATNITTAGNCAAIFAVSGGPGTPPVITTQPQGFVTDTLGNPIVTNNPAVQNSVIITKGYQGTNNITLITSNLLSSGVSYQWKKAPRGGGFRDLFDTFDTSPFVNVSGPNIGGATGPVLTISNATLNDTADYILVATNQFGSQTSFVATVMVLTTNYSLLVGAANGDTITKYTADGTSSGAESFPSAIDQLLQKWLSTGLGSVGIDGVAVASGTVPFVGPVGYVVTPSAGRSFVNAIRFYCANDTPGRDPRDYTLEGSDDGANWTTITRGQLLGTLMLPAGRNGVGAIQLNPMTQFLTEVDFANATAYTSYRFTITNCMEPVNTPLMQLAEIQFLGSFVPAPPTWLRQPLPTLKAFVGSSPQLTALATGLGALAPSYQWYQFPATLIPGATSSAFTRTNVQFSDSGTQFYCVAQNQSGSITSDRGQFTIIARPTNSYPTTVMADNLMSYWRLDEPETGGGNNGMLAYDYYGGHNGSYSNVVLGVTGYSPFDPDTAMQTSGPDNLVNGIFDVDFARASGNAAFSVEAWAYGSTPVNNTGTWTPATGNNSPTAPDSMPAVVAKGNNGRLSPGIGTGTEQFALDYYNGTDISGFRFLIRGPNGQGYQAQSSSPASDRVTGGPAWHHLVGVCDMAHGSGTNGTVNLYVDGLLAATGTVPTNTGILTQPLPMTIGSRRNTQADNYNNNWIGTVDDVAVYPYSLSATQVLAHFRASQRPPIIQGPAYLLLPSSGGGTNWIAANNVPVTFPANAYGPGTVSYQWWHSDNLNPTTPISGVTSSNYTFLTTPALDQTYYQLVVSNQYGAVTSAVVTLSVHAGAPDFIVDLPASQTLNVGHIMQLHVNPGGTGPFTYQWQKNGANISDDYRTSGSHSDTLTMGYLAGSDAATYSVLVTGQLGTTPSTLDAVSVVPALTFFGATSTGWTLNGGAVMNGNSVRLTDAGNQARSAYLTNKQNIASFNIAFDYQDVTGAGGADGATFCIQNQAVTQVGGGGGSVGYDGITPSVALALNIYAPNTRGIAFAQNGVRGTPYQSLLPNVGIGDNTNVVRVTVNYNGSVLAATFRDTITDLSVTTNWTVNIPSIVGASTAWVGFTAATGGTASTQVMAWLPGPSPVKMTAQKVGNNLVLSWPAATAGYLMASPTVGPAAVWTQSTAPWQLIGDQTTGTVQVTVPIAASGASYLRLQEFP